jgi:N-glycosylase/DNA lyase
LFIQALDFGKGIRILRQDKWEALLSFIISQNNNIPRIKKIIASMRSYFGGFPKATQIASENVENLKQFKLGYRAEYIANAAKRVTSGETDLTSIAEMPYSSAKKELLKILGVGSKVADCVLLFGMHKLEAFPVDVWIKRALQTFYPLSAPECFTGEYAGLAQQYLFHYIRSHQSNLNM